MYVKDQQILRFPMLPTQKKCMPYRSFWKSAICWPPWNTAGTSYIFTERCTCKCDRWLVIPLTPKNINLRSILEKYRSTLQRQLFFQLFAIIASVTQIFNNVETIDVVSLVYALLKGIKNTVSRWQKTMYHIDCKTAALMIVFKDYRREADMDCVASQANLVQKLKKSHT